MKRIVHKEQSQRRVPEEQLFGCETVVEGFCARIMEPASELRTIEVRRFSCVIGRRASNVQAFGHSAN
ncbi:MAG: hypothetical protein ACLTFM_03900 [Blautia wexlerae]